MLSSLFMKFKEFLFLHFWICSHHFAIFGLFDLPFPFFFLTIVLLTLSITFVTSPTIARSTFIILLIEDGSISIWTFFELGENSSIFPVIRSSNLAPMFINKSQSCIALFASYVPCIPSIPKNWLSSPG